MDRECDCIDENKSFIQELHQCIYKKSMEEKITTALLKEVGSEFEGNMSTIVNIIMVPGVDKVLPEN